MKKEEIINWWDKWYTQETKLVMPEIAKKRMEKHLTEFAESQAPNKGMISESVKNNISELLLELIDQVYKRQYKTGGATDVIADSLNSRVSTFLVEVLPKLSPQETSDNWVKCSERMPDEYGQPTDYLTCIQNGDIIQSCWFDGFGQFDDKNNFIETDLVTHWQPLPKEPKDIQK